eukprot:7421120-Lingulodinium_polyedra.AAC.1
MPLVKTATATLPDQAQVTLALQPALGSVQIQALPEQARPYFRGNGTGNSAPASGVAWATPSGA